MEAGAPPVGARRRRGRGAVATFVAVAGAAGLVGIGAGALIHALGRASGSSGTVLTARYGLYGQAVWAPGARPAPAIDTLTDQSGRPFALSSLHGRTVALVFFDSHCNQECPLEGRELAAAEQSLPEAQRPVVVAVSVNPADTPASAAHAARAWGLAGAAPWHWLMGDRRALARVWRAYHVYVGAAVNGDIPHTEAVVLIDRRGDERAGYLYPFNQGYVTHDLGVLARRLGGTR
jgi:cytochrome oxidase Cu insertion factor (SCO1/SenC/PrrC family)